MSKMQFISKATAGQRIVFATTTNAFSNVGISAIRRSSSIRQSELRLFSTCLPASTLTRSYTSLSKSNTEKWTFERLALQTIRFVSTATGVSQPEITSLIENNKVVVFSKSTCPFCSSTKRLFERMAIVNVVVIELDLLPEGREIQSLLQEMTGQRTVPNVFVNGKHFGGNSDIQMAAKSGALQEILK
jgi:glutaredoxin 3